MTISNEKAAAKAFIIRNITLFKKCCGCGSVIHSKHTTCHYCASYRFKTDIKTVLTQLEVITTKPSEPTF
jgi:uncharacterized OB-fold protein